MGEYYEAKKQRNFVIGVREFNNAPFRSQIGNKITNLFFF